MLTYADISYMLYPQTSARSFSSLSSLLNNLTTSLRKAVVRRARHRSGNLFLFSLSLSPGNMHAVM
jgi:hypothetical protein